MNPAVGPLRVRAQSGLVADVEVERVGREAAARCALLVDELVPRAVILLEHEEEADHLLEFARRGVRIG